MNFVLPFVVPCDTLKLSRDENQSPVNIGQRCRALPYWFFWPNSVYFVWVRVSVWKSWWIIISMLIWQVCPRNCHYCLLRKGLLSVSVIGLLRIQRYDSTSFLFLRQSYYVKCWTLLFSPSFFCYYDFDWKSVCLYFVVKNNLATFQYSNNKLNVICCNPTHQYSKGDKSMGQPIYLSVHWENDRTQNMIRLGYNSMTRLEWRRWLDVSSLRRCCWRRNWLDFVSLPDIVSSSILGSCPSILSSSPSKDDLGLGIRLHSV